MSFSRDKGRCDIVFIVFVGICITIVENHVCLLMQRPDSSGDGALRWSLRNNEICRCEMVFKVTPICYCQVFPPVDVDPQGCLLYASTDLLFLEFDAVEQLVRPENWNKPTLDTLLNRTSICYGVISTTVPTTTFTTSASPTTTVTTTDAATTSVTTTAAPTTTVTTTLAPTTTVTTTAAPITTVATTEIQTTTITTTDAPTTTLTSTEIPTTTETTTTSPTTTVQTTTAEATTTAEPTTTTQTTTTHTTTPAPPELECASNWEAFGESCYYFNSEQAYTYDQARSACIAESATLTSIHSTEEQTFLAHWDNTASFWIGLNDKQTPGTYIWEDGSQYDFSNWNIGEPTSTTVEECVHLWSANNNNWNNAGCTHNNGYICKRPRGPVCAPNWEAFGEYCYYFNSQQEHTYDQARSSCIAENATLTSIHSTEEHTFLSQWNTHFWIGLNDIQTAYTWIWEDGSKYVFTKWNSGEPSNGGGVENCVHLWPEANNNWNDRDCTILSGYICKRPKGCAANWISHENHCYFVHTTTDSTYQQARDACVDMAATLTSVTDADEFDFLAQLHRNAGEIFLWIGLNDISSEGTYIWEDGTPYSLANSHWFPSNPDNSGNEDCVHITGDGLSLWNDYPCGYTNGYICKRTQSWMLTFKAVAEIAQTTETDPLVYDPYEVWKSPTPINDNNPAAKLLDNSFSGHYKNMILDQHLGEIKEIKIGLYNSAGEELLHMTFNMVGVTDRDGWFQKSRLLSSPYEDIISESQNYFNIPGVALRRWYLSQSHAGCPEDYGWLAIVANLNPTCEWDLSGAPKPVFLYSLKNTYINWNVATDVGKADVLAIFVKMDYL